MPVGMRNNKKKDWTRCREKVESEGRCRACKKIGPVDPAHTISRAQGGAQEPESVIPLCRDCHRKEHAGELDLLPLLTRDEEVEAVRVVGISRAYRMLGGES